MIDEDLEALHGILRRMKPDALVQIGVFNCHARELFWIVEEAMSARVQAKAAGTFEPFISALSE